MKQITVKAPAKINLTLEILNRRPDGFHNLQSIMQTISLYDYLTLKIQNASASEIKLSGNSENILYDKNNTAYKAAVKFFEKTDIKNTALDIYIEKYIPVSAGLAGGSADAAGVFYALNKLFNNPLNDKEINELCASIGSDINFCLKGGCCLCTSRGEITEPLPVYNQKVSLIKPKNVSVSTKEAYAKFAALKDKSNPDSTNKLKKLLEKGEFDNSLLYNSLEAAVFPSFEELRIIKSNVKNSFMTGSGSMFFVLSDKLETNLNRNNYEIFENLETIKEGVSADNLHPVLY